MGRNFFACSVGQPGEDYDEENLERIFSNMAFVFHENTKQIGFYDKIKEHDVLILKYRKMFIAYGEAIERKRTNNQGWNMWATVKEWIHFDVNDVEKGITTYGIQGNTLEGAGQMGAVKGLETNFAIDVLKKINNNSDLIINILLEINMEKHIELLKNSKNIIFTGAPGTGKTYLAKQIANQFVNKTSVNPKVVLNEAIKTYKIDTLQKEKNEKLLKEFYEKFPLDKIPELSLEEYCTGYGDNNSFCYWIEHNLYPLGSYAPAQRGSWVYGIYYSKAEKVYHKKKELDKKTDEEALKEITKLIYNAFQSEEGIRTALRSNLFDNGFLLKILSSYKPNEYLPIHSHSHINNCLSLFEIDCNKNSTIVEKNRTLVDFYKKIVTEESISLHDFMLILYHNFNMAKGEIRDGKQIILTGDKEFVQFHPSYDYSDFVEGLRPIKKEGQSELGFELKNGIFKTFCKTAKENPNKDYVFIIDEINRAEISKVFGELFFCIDPGYRGEKGKVKTKFDNLQTEDTYFTSLENDSFYIPDNVYIIGTMNDIDRSVEPFDFAMRRRFTFVEITADETAESILDGLDMKEELIARLKRINTAIDEIEGLNSSYHIGAAYFRKIENYKNEELVEQFNKLWSYHLQPLLKEYLRGYSDQKENLEKLQHAYDGN